MTPASETRGPPVRPVTWPTSTTMARTHPASDTERADPEPWVGDECRHDLIDDATTGGTKEALLGVD